MTKDHSVDLQEGLIRIVKACPGRPAWQPEQLSFVHLAPDSLARVLLKLKNLQPQYFTTGKGVLKWGNYLVALTCFPAAKGPCKNLSAEAGIRPTKQIA